MQNVHNNDQSYLQDPRHRSTFGLSDRVEIRWLQSVRNRKYQEEILMQAEIDTPFRITIEPCFTNGDNGDIGKVRIGIDYSPMFNDCMTAEKSNRDELQGLILRAVSDLNNIAPALCNLGDLSRQFILRTVDRLAADVPRPEIDHSETLH
jgi:hypothetical protein